MTDRDPARPEQVPPEQHAPDEPPYAEPAPVDYPAPEPHDHPEPPLEPIPDLAPAPEPEAPPEHAPEPIEAEPHSNVEVVADPTGPDQIASEPAPDLSVLTTGSLQAARAEPVAAEGDAPVSLEFSTADTLALPPTTAAVEPPVVSSAPPPPTGVPVPFAAPPTERNGAKLGLTLGFGIGGGLIAAGALFIAVIMAVVTMTNSVAEAIQDTAAQFVGELADEDGDGAYALLCEDLRDRPADEYIAEWESWDPASAEVQPLAFDDVDVRVRLADGSEIALIVQVDQTSQALGTSICGWYDVED
jgi:hypothetical protein